MLEEVRALLSALGAEAEAEDGLLRAAVESVLEQVQNETNCVKLPPGLRRLAAEMAAGKYLMLKKDLGELEGFDTEAAVRELREGDTSVVFATGSGSLTPEQRLDALISMMTEGRRRELIRYRRVVW